MRKQKSKRIKRILATLLTVCFLLSIITMPASATSLKNTRNYKLGYQFGYYDGYKVGYNAGYDDCVKYGQKGVLTKIPSPVIKKKWTKIYIKGYKDGLKKGYIVGYNKGRLKCL